MVVIGEKAVGMDPGAEFMAGARKFAIKYIERSDLVALTREASEVTGIR